MNNALERVLRDQCQLENWHPTPSQLASIKQDILTAIRSGKTLSRTDCQHIVVRHCGSARMLLQKGVDNSDLNSLLIQAIEQAGKS
jgi:hypothetical protein